ncbi:M16 family metallopeptidase [Brytella acorum]|uniref:Pitrilysin family protein n=1 Tax=Brytella acorum TaxID=2959299 RepID=A0AA35Y0S0_9PROT|nr:pitrilysin family protein [Brytella acorum]MDF3623680.1 pitrilysin family protein [Brytella acorum]CAI9119902.1 pitrilysin family protein [Brytella acorum]
MTRSSLPFRRFLMVASLPVLTLAATPLAHADSFPTTPPPPGPAPVLSFPTPERFTLANGLEVVFARRDKLPLVTAELVIKSGSSADPEGLAGLADITAQMLTHGAGGMSAVDLVSAAEALGSSLSTEADEDSSTISMTVLTPNLGKALDMIGRVALSPDFAGSELQRVRGEASDSVRMRLSRPGAMAAAVVGRQAFGSGSYGHPEHGTPTSLARMTVAALKQFHDTYYRPDNAVLVLTGDISRADAERLASGLFGTWTRPSSVVPAVPAPVQPSALGRVVVVDQPGTGQAGVAVAHLVPRRNDAGYYGGVVANAVLGSFYSSRLNEEIRIKRGLSYGASSHFMASRDAGLLSAAIQTKNPSAAEVSSLTLGEFDGLVSRPPSENELAARKATLVGNYGRSFETTEGLASRVAPLVLYGLDLSEITRYVPAIQAVTIGDVTAYARAHFDARGTDLAVVGDARQFLPALRRMHPELVVMASSDVDLDRPDLRKSPTKNPSENPSHPK